MTTQTRGQRRPNPRVDLELPCDPRSGARAREAVLELADDLHPETLAKVRLLVTELVVAALGPEETRPFRLSVVLGSGQVRAELTPIPADGDGRDPRDWGLFLVERISDRWGSREDGSMWFEVAARRFPRRFARLHAS